MKSILTVRHGTPAEPTPRRLPLQKAMAKSQQAARQSDVTKRSIIEAGNASRTVKKLNRCALYRAGQAQENKTFVDSKTGRKVKTLTPKQYANKYGHIKAVHDKRGKCGIDFKKRS